MSTTDILIASLLVIILMLGFAFAGKIFEQLPARALKYLDYGSFGTAIVMGVSLYFGVKNAAVWYLFLISIIIYFITLRHTIHEDASRQG